MAAETQYTANTGMVSISTANSGRDGSGTVGTVLTAGAYGTLVKNIFIKSITDTSQGMIRLFVTNPMGITTLIKEFMVPAITKASINKAFEMQIPMDYTIAAGSTLKASTEVANTFNIIAEGLDWTYYSYGVRMDTTKYTANTGTVIIDTANSNLDGTGTLGLAYTAGSSPTYKGSSIESITIKTSVNDTPGMVRLYLDNSTNKFCFKEIVIPTITKSATDQSFEHTIVFDNDLELQAGYKIQASTQNAEAFHIMVNGNDWNYYS